MEFYFVLILIIVAVVLIGGLFFLGSFMGGKPNRLSILVQEPAFSQIKSGKKTIEVRVGKPDIYKKGAKLRIKSPEKQKLIATVVEARPYKSLDELMKKETAAKIVPGVKSKEDATAVLMELKNKAGNVVYDPTKVAEYGVVAIELQV